MTVAKKQLHRDKILKQARLSLKKGRFVVPVPAGRKGPRLTGWTNLRLKENQLTKYFGESDNVGWLLGEASGNLCDVDLDCRAAILLAKRFLPRTKRIHGREGKSGSHWWYRATPLPNPVKFTDVDGTCLAELRTNGQQTLIPPSIHPNGSLLRWESVGEPSSVDGEVLRNAVSRVAAGALLKKHWPGEGHRHDAANALAGMLLRAGWKEDGVAEFVEGVAEAAGDEESRQRVQSVVSTAKKLGAGGRATGAPALAAIVGDDVVSRVRQFLRLGLATFVETDDWSVPAPIGDDLPAVEAFSADLLPSSFRPLVEDVSERMQTPPDYAAAVAVVALAGCVSRRATMQPKAKDNSWLVVPNLWGAVVAPPGFMKTPVLNAVTSPLNHIEAFWRAQHEEELTEFAKAKGEATLRKEVWRQQYKEALKKGVDVPLEPDDSMAAPVQRRLVTTDSTFEKLHEILSENPAGLLVIRDELSGWLSGLDREGREGERGFFLQAWSGDMGYTIDRIGRGSIFVPAVCLSLLGNIQPTRLRWYLADTVRGGANDDGLFQRFQIMVWPDTPRSWAPVDRPPDGRALGLAERIFSQLANLSVDDPVRLRFGKGAQELFSSWLAVLEGKVRGDSGLSPALVGHLSKYRSLMPTLSALFQLADCVADGDSLIEQNEVSIEHAQQAVALCNYLESHARRVYSCVLSPERRAAGELARHIKRGVFTETFATRDVYLKGWSGLDTPDKARSALGVLEDAAWVHKVEVRQSPVGGRPSETWMINPKVKQART